MNLDVENNFFRRVMLVVGPALAGLVAWSLFLAGHPSEICWTAAITVLCAAWWVTEAIPIPATSLIPMALLVQRILNSRMIFRRPSRRLARRRG